MHDRPVMAMIARGQQLRPLAKSFQSLITDLSTGLTTAISAVLAPIKRLTNRPSPQRKHADQKTTTALQATVSKAFSQLHPRYSQPAPQQTGTSQNCGKTAICSGFMSRFGRLAILFSTISGKHTKTPVEDTCGSEPARDSSRSVNVEVTDPPLSRAGSLPH